MSSRNLIHMFASALLSSEWSAEALTAQTQRTFGKKYKWIPELVDRILERFPKAPRPRLASLKKMLHQDFDFALACKRNSQKIAKISLSPPGMAPLPAASVWKIPAFSTDGDLCKWLQITPEHLDWFADIHRRERFCETEQLRNYSYRWFKKRSGGIRLIEMPKSALKSIQRRILSEILNYIPAHGCACGFRRGKNVEQFVAPHSDKAFVLRADLEDFFLTVPVSRVHAIFSTAGYPERVSRILAGLCTNSVPPHVVSTGSRMDTRPLSGMKQALLRTPHLPQGAPTSPALANLCAYRLDVRLQALARKSGWTYTRYADDLVISGNWMSAVGFGRLKATLARIVADEKFKLNLSKTRFMPASQRQHAAGLVLNSSPNGFRTEFDALKAILFNCARHGVATQNKSNHPHFRTHLIGRIDHVARYNPVRGEKLRDIFQRIKWN